MTPWHGINRFRRTTMFKLRVPNAILLTVPFTGTHFTQTVLTEMTRSHGWYIASAHWLDEVVANEWNKIVRRKIIVTSRNPYLSAIRSIKAYGSIDDSVNQWNCMLDKLPQLNYFVFNVECEERHRERHLSDLAAFLGISNNMKIKWIPENVSTSAIKEKYTATQELPEGHDWDKLNDAISWHKTLTTNT